MADPAQEISRRTLLGGLAAAALASRLGAEAPPAATAPEAAQPVAPAPKAGSAAAMQDARPPSAAAQPASVAVVGAGAFGAFTALALRRLGARVTLLDAWGPGNSRASSGGETRVLRAVYADRIYVELAARAFERWAEFERRTGRTFFHPTGALWMVTDGSDFVARAAENLRAVGFPYARLDTAEAARRFPQIAFGGVRWALWEERAGFLLARQACAAAVDALVAAGGEYRLARVEPGAIAAAGMEALRLGDGSRVKAEAYVFACGPWLGELFPAVLGPKIAPTRQEVFFFGTPAGDPRFEPPAMPVWIEAGERLFYGIPGNERRGFKVADDTRGPAFDPTSGQRTPSDEALARARALLRRRFPALADAPLEETRVCQYENSPDLNFILDRHPEAANAWLVGGGSGHGFKFAPAWGEQVAETVLGRRPPDPFFALARLSGRKAALAGD
ncbi:MAG TPA: FAD-dependent oxidoreductase [Thermoanaerobaculia bacterium]|nr:FAD-dependent oxidoreductase [Thermoanaerobaculia bacterium]